MKLVCLPILFGVMLGSSVIGAGQASTAQQQPSPLPKIADTLIKRLDGMSPGGTVSRAAREQAYAKLMEGQRYLWSAKRLRSRAGIAHASTSARQALQKAVELDPKLAEAYTALAEIAINSQPVDVEEGIALAAIATRLDHDNFGGHRVLARLYTYKCRLNGDNFDSVFGNKAIAEWKEVTRLDPRNAEAWAFLGELYNKTGKNDERISALKNWLSSVPPIETQFYTFVMGRQENLSPENASLKLGPALLKSGRTKEAIQTLSNVVADDPDNAKAVDLLREALESADGTNAAIAIESLQQAVYANPANLSLIGLLAQVYQRIDRVDDAVILLREASDKLTATDRTAAGAIQISLGDILISSGRTADAMAAYEEALKVRGLDNAEMLDEDEREFVMLVFEKMIQALKSADRPGEVNAMIVRARKLLGKNDLFSDRQLIAFYRESGRRQEALDAVRAVRSRLPDDYGFLRLEATMLTELGRVDEAVALVRKSMARPPAAASNPASSAGGDSVMIAVPPSDQFSDYLFISSLYSQANRGKEAADAANQAYSVARGKERKQIARLTLATAQQLSGDFDGAETTLREILKESPNNPIAMNNLGYYLLERNLRLEEAFELIQQAVRVDPTNPSFLDSLGWAHYKLGRLTEAEKHLREASRYNSGSATIQEHLGDVYLKQGRVDQAKTSWEKALVLASEDSDIKRLKEKLAGK